MSAPAPHALLVVDGGMWTDPALYGPFPSYEDAAGTAEALGVPLYDDEPDADEVAIPLPLNDPEALVSRAGLA